MTGDEFLVALVELRCQLKDLTAALDKGLDLDDELVASAARSVRVSAVRLEAVATRLALRAGRAAA